MGKQDLDLGLYRDAEIRKLLREMNELSLSAEQKSLLEAAFITLKKKAQEESTKAALDQLFAHFRERQIASDEALHSMREASLKDLPHYVIREQRDLTNLVELSEIQAKEAAGVHARLMEELEAFFKHPDMVNLYDNMKQLCADAEELRTAHAEHLATPLTPDFTMPTVDTKTVQPEAPAASSSHDEPAVVAASTPKAKTAVRADKEDLDSTRFSSAGQSQLDTFIAKLEQFQARRAHAMFIHDKMSQLLATHKKHSLSVPHHINRQVQQFNILAQNLNQFDLGHFMTATALRNSLYVKPHEPAYTPASMFKY